MSERLPARVLANSPLGGRLWHDRDFLLLWAGESISLIGSRVSILALPSIAILYLHAGPLVTGTLVAVQWVPYMLLGSIAGVWADRRHRRPLLISTNLVRAALMALIPLAWVTHVLALWQIYLVAAASGVFAVLFQVAFRAYIPTLLSRETFIEGNAKLQFSQAIAQVAGTPLAGLLIGWFGAAWAVIGDAISFLVAGLSLTGVKAAEPEPPAASGGPALRGALADLAAGYRISWRDQILRNLAGMAALGNLALSMYAAVLLLFLYRDLKLSPAQVGVALGIGSLGFVLGAFFSQAVTTRIGVGRTLLLCAVLLGAGYLILPLARHGDALVLVTLSQFLASLQAGPVNVSIMTLVQLVTPRELMGRVAGVSLTFVWGGSAVGGLIGGVLGAAFGDSAALAISGVVALASGLFVLGPVLRFVAPGQQPAAQEKPAHAQAGG